MELRDYLRVASARKWIIIQAAIVVTVVALVGSIVQTRQYEAQSEVLVRERSGGPTLFTDIVQDFTFQPERRLQTQVELMKARPLAETVIKRLNLQTTPDRLLTQVQVDPVGQTDIIDIKVTDTNPRRATDIANAWANGYVNLSRDSAQIALKQARDAVSLKLDDVQTQLFGVAKQITQRESAHQLVPEELKAQLQVGTGLFVTLSGKLEELTIQEALEQGLGLIVSPAVLPDAPVRPRPVLNTILGLIVGLVLGVGGALLAEYLDNTIKTGEDAERYYGVPTLARVPSHGPKDQRSHQVVVLGGPHTPESEAYRSLRTSLDYLNFDGSLKKILVTSAAPREGKSTTLVNLAASIAQAGKRVLIIGCDFRRPAVHQFFGLKNKVGLSDVLTGRVSLRSAIQDSGVPNLGILLSGPLPPNPSELLGSATMRSLLDHAASVADYILIDSPPVLAVTDSAVLAPMVDGILIVCEAGASTREAAQAAMGVLAPSETRILGVVLNNAGPQERHGYYYYYDYYRSSDDARAGGEAEASGEEFLRAEAPVSAEEQAQAESGPKDRRHVSKSKGKVEGRRKLASWLFSALAVAAIIAVVAAIIVLVDLALGLGLMKAIVSNLHSAGVLGALSAAAASG